MRNVPLHREEDYRTNSYSFRLWPQEPQRAGLGATKSFEANRRNGDLLSVKMC